MFNIKKHNTKNRQKSWFKRLLHYKSSEPIKNSDNVDLSALEELAITDEQKDILKMIEHETIPSVRDAWIDYFIKHTKTIKGKCD